MPAARVLAAVVAAELAAVAPAVGAAEHAVPVLAGLDVPVPRPYLASHRAVQIPVPSNPSTMPPRQLCLRVS